MRGDIRLGLRLAGVGRGRERVRAAMVVLASAVGGWVLLGTLAAAHSEWQLGFSLYDAAGMRNLLLAVITVVAMSVVVLVASVARLSASVRDRRLAGLRLLGLPPARTRLVAAVESGAGAVAGSVLGVGLFWLTRPVVSQLQVAGRDWSGTSFTPWPLAAVMVVMGLPALSVVAAVLPTRGLRRDILAGVRLAAVRRPSPWRLLPLAIGLVLVEVAPSSDGTISNVRLAAFVAGVVLCGLGALLVVPVLTRLVADLLVRIPGRPPLRIAGRRLQAQPAGVTRVVAGLLIGLFLVTGGRMVVGAFENTQPYVAAALAIEGGNAPYEVDLPRGADPDAVAEHLAGVDQAKGAYVDQTVRTACRGTGGPCLTAFVGTCADLTVAVPGSSGCDDASSGWLGGDSAAWAGDPSSGLAWRGHGDRLRLPAPTTTIALPDDVDPDIGVNLQVFLPETTPRLGALTGPGTEDVVVVVDPGAGVQRDLRSAVAAVAPGARIHPDFARPEYEFVAGLRALVWAVAAVVLAVGLLGFAISAVDRTIGRRAEMVSLQLVGTPRRVIRAAQWWEAALPLALGLPLAVLLGWSVGSGYLALGGALEARPGESVLGLAGISVAAALLVAGLTVVACAPRVRADLIRRT